MTRVVRVSICSIVPGDGFPGDLLDRAGELDAGRAAADDPERQHRAPRFVAAFVFGRLEREQDAPPQLGGILERLQARRDRRPVVVAEVGVRGPGRQDQVVVPDMAARQTRRRVRDVHAG